MFKLKIFILVFLLLLTGILGANTSHAADRETAYDRVMRTGVIRCGYGEWDPIIIQDPKTKQLSGIFYDYAEALGKELNLKIEWIPLTWSSWVTDLEIGKFDAACVGIWPQAGRARAADFTIPIYYHVMQAYVRSDDMRFDNRLDKANDPSVTFVGMDGALSQILATQLFPQAKLASIPEMTPAGTEMMYVTTKKADIVISDKVTVENYMAKNPGSLRLVKTDRPITVLGNTMGLKIGEHDFRQMLDNATRDLINRGVIAEIISKYEKYPGSMMPVAKPYEMVP